MKVLVIAFDQRPRYKTIIRSLEENGILYDFLELSNSGLISNIKKIKQAHQTTRATHTILIGFDRVAITWIFICSLLRLKQPIIRLGGDPIKVPLSRMQHKKQRAITSLKQKLRLSILKIALKLPKEFITVSKSLADSSSLVKKNCFVLPIHPQLINVKPKQYRLHNNNNINLLTVTNLNYHEKYQGVLHIIKSAVAVSKNHSITLSIVGGGDYLTKLKQDIKKYKQDNLKIVITGHVDKVMHYYNNTDIFAYHSTLDSWPNVLMEAMAHGLPIIANDNQQFSEVFCEKQKNFLCKNNDKHCFSRALLSLIKHPQIYNDCAKLSISRALELRSNKKITSELKLWLQKTYVKE